MATRYSGKAVISVTYRDRGDYQCAVAIGKRAVWSGRIGAPKSGYGRGVAYDSPAAYDQTAEAALSFAEDETGIVGDAAEYAPGGDGWHIGRSLATRHGKQANPSRARKTAASKHDLYDVSVWDAEGGYWHHHVWMLGSSAKAVEQTYLLQHPDLDSDDVQVKRQTHHRQKKVPNPAKRKALTAAPVYFYSLYREVVTPESAENGEADHTDEIARDEGPFRRLSDLLDAAGAKNESWDWSSSHPSTGHEWLSTQDDNVDWRTGESSTLSLHIRRAKNGPLSMKDIEYISDALGVRLRTRKTATKTKAAPKRKAPKKARRRPW